MRNGVTIGQARVYNFSLADSSYSNSSSTFDLYLFDVQTYTKLVLGNLVASAYCPASSYIKGLSSGATGYVVTSPGSGSTEIHINTNFWRIYSWRANFYSIVVQNIFVQLLL